MRFKKLLKEFYKTIKKIFKSMIIKKKKKKKKKKREV